MHNNRRQFVLALRASTGRPTLCTFCAGRCAPSFAQNVHSIGRPCCGRYGYLVMEEFIKNDLKSLQSAFPNGITDDEYFPLIDALYGEYSNRNLATLLSEFLGTNYFDLTRDIDKSQSSGKSDELKVSKVRHRLNEAGFTWDD
ncbi:hypothetical protein [Microbulbifer variabilis]|uniref:hypothetical protein n=1 Tax=Microbulbifer variabilis TaxID=266805 RepID=UPI001CFE0999|nr:hypothetical protein [Microbulbifer variabilis]